MTCVWEADFTGFEDKWAAFDEEVQQRALMLATSTLQALTLNRVGTCPITIRPCPMPRCCACDNWFPVLSPGDWFGGMYYCRGCTRGCAPLSEVDIPGPVGFIDSLRIDGQEVDLGGDDWRLDEGHLLVWQGAGASPIPTYQDLNKADTKIGTWSITYSKSYPVLADAKIAVAMLAMEYAAAMKPKGKCSLPRGVTNVVRNGVTFTVDAGLFVNGLTGIEVVDAFITKWVPLGTPQRSATVYVPGQNKPRRTNSVPLRVSGNQFINGGSI